MAENPSRPTAEGAERARAFAEIKALWRRVHAAQNKRTLAALDRVYLEGMEDVLDWLMGNTCPNGDTRHPRPLEFTSGFGWTLMMVPAMAAKDARDENGAVFFTRPPVERRAGAKKAAAPPPQGASGPTS